MILTDNINTFTDTKASEKERVITNSNSIVTIGGKVINQADSRRLAISVEHRLTKAQYDSLAAIINNFSQALYYTPTNILLTKSAIAQIEVVIGDVDIREWAYNGTRVLIISYELQEVIA